MPSQVWWDGTNLKAWIGGILSTITLPSSGGGNGGSNIPFFPESEDKEFESPFIPKSSPGIINEITFTTTGNIDDLDFSNSPLIRMNNASDATIRGLKAGYPGQIVTIVSVGAGHVFLAHQNVNSSAGNRLINFATGSTTPLAAGIGTSTYTYDVTTSRWRLISHNQGSFISVVYNAANFTRGGGTWDVDSADQETYAYFLNGRILTLATRISNTNVTGAGVDSLRIAIPNGFMSTKLIPNVAYTVDAGGSREVGLMFSDIGVSFIEYRRPLSVVWTVTSSNNTQVFGLITFEVD